MRYNRVANGEICEIVKVDESNVIYKHLTRTNIRRPDGLFEEQHNVICNFFDKVD